MPVKQSIGDPFFFDNVGAPPPKIPTFTGGGGITVTGGSIGDNTISITPPDWQEEHFILKDQSDRPVGLFKGPIDANSGAHFTLYQPDQPECPMMPLLVTILDPMDYDTQVNFQTLPILEVWHYASGGILLKFPE
jgi:hypothetical protein